MEVREGFIVGIFNYCDGWCQRCAFTSRCHLFADRAEIEARLDALHAPIVNAPPLPHEAEPEPPRWMQELIEEANEACRQPLSPEEWERLKPRVPSEHAPVNARAKRYGFDTSRWLTAHQPAPGDGTDDPREVIAWFQFLIGAKVNRALTTWPDDDHQFAASDGDGSAKVALLGIDQSHAAWLELVERGAVPSSEADPFIVDLVWLGEALERIRPRARAFVRPGLDEPDAVARLLASERLSAL
jgi:hypothetical protein